MKCVAHANYRFLTILLDLTFDMLKWPYMLEKALPQRTAQYLNQVLGEGAVLIENSDAVAQLPYYLHDTYEVLSGRLLGDPVIFACVKNGQPLAAKQVAQHAQQLRDLLHVPVLVVLRAIAPGERKQLIQQGVPFVVPNTQLFAPHMGMILTERFVAQLPTDRDLASPATQALLIWFLNHHPATETWSPFEEAAALGYAGMTATRAVRELLQFGLFELEVRGRAKYLKLAVSRRELWERAKTYLRNPVLRTLWTYDRQVFDVCDARLAGESALATMTMLNEPSQPVIAMTAEAVEQAKQSGVFFEPRPIADGVAVQVWRYRPDIVAKTKNVDPLSLWLSLRDNRDHRIQIALAEIEEPFLW